MLRAGGFRYASPKQKRKRHARRGNKAVRGGSGVGHPVDRLSALPDELLHEVLRHLQAQQVVQTCVLSTRWRHLWRSVPCISIDQREFRASSYGSSLYKQQRFINFAHILLRCRDVACLDEFRLHIDSDLSQHAYSWVRSSLSQDDPWLCQLKTLHLSNVILDNYFGRHISSWCPALEDMELKSCTYLLTEPMWIVSSTLKKAVISGFRYTEDEFRGVILEVPALASLGLTGGYYYISGAEYSHVMPSLVDASICLPAIEDSEPDFEDDYSHAMDQLDLLGMLFNVTSLHLSRFSAMCLTNENVRLEFPELKNLKTLSLIECDISDDFLTLEHFLRNSPNLQKLTLRCCET